MKVSNKVKTKGKQITSSGDLILDAIKINLNSTIREAIKCIDHSGKFSIAIVVDKSNKVEAVITDGDVRRGILQNIDLNAPVSELLKIKTNIPNSKPVLARYGTDHGTLVKIMEERRIRQLPLIDGNGRIREIVLFSELNKKPEKEIQAVVMAGGFGRRLRPYTNNIPKPMLKVGGRPIIAQIVARIQAAGIRRFTITTHYKPEKIKRYFGDGSKHGIEIEYLHEDTPLGTAGALSMLSNPNLTTLVVNGDILCEIDYRQMKSYHQDHSATMTVASNINVLKSSYGVLNCSGSKIIEIKEKPEFRMLVNAGIYILEPTAISNIPQGEKFDMTDLIRKLVASNRDVVSFPLREEWIDIGQPSDYKRAQARIKS